MTKAEAQQRCAERQQACPAGDDRRFLARELEPGVWGVVQLRVAGLDAVGSVRNAAVESRPRPEQPPDPRPGIFRNIPPFGPG